MVSIYIEIFPRFNVEIMWLVWGIHSLSTYLSTYLDLIHSTGSVGAWHLAPADFEVIIFATGNCGFKFLFASPVNVDLIALQILTNFAGIYITENRNLTASPQISSLSDASEFKKKIILTCRIWKNSSHYYFNGFDRFFLDFSFQNKIHLSKFL